MNTILLNIFILLTVSFILCAALMKSSLSIKNTKVFGNFNFHQYEIVLNIILVFMSMSAIALYQFSYVTKVELILIMFFAYMIKAGSNNE